MAGSNNSPSVHAKHVMMKSETERDTWRKTVGARAGRFLTEKEVSVNTLFSSTESPADWTAVLARGERREVCSALFFVLR